MHLHAGKPSHDQAVAKSVFSATRMRHIRATHTKTAHAILPSPVFLPPNTSTHPLLHTHHTPTLNTSSWAMPAYILNKPMVKKPVTMIE